MATAWRGTRTMLRRQDEFEVAVRVALISVSAYIGGVGGIAFTNGGHVERSMFNPVATLGLLIGSTITPVANILLIISIPVSIAYMVTRVPRWTCVVWGLMIGIIVATVRLRWRAR